MIIYKLRKNTLNLIMSDILKLYIIYFMIMRYSSVINIGTITFLTQGTVD